MDGPRYLPTAAAAAYCGYRTADALRVAKARGLVRPCGRRQTASGLRPTDIYAVTELDRFLGILESDGAFTEQPNSSANLTPTLPIRQGPEAGKMSHPPRAVVPAAARGVPNPNPNQEGTAHARPPPPRPRPGPKRAARGRPR